MGKPEWRVIVDLLRDVDPVAFNRIGRKMMHYLFKQNVKRAEALLQQIDGLNLGARVGDGSAENQPSPRVEAARLENIMFETFEIAEQELKDREILDLVTMWLRQERIRFMTRAVERRDIPLGDITKVLDRFETMTQNFDCLSQEERLGIRVALIRRFFTEDLDFINTTKGVVQIADFAEILRRVIGPRRGNGKLGGKAAGLFRADKTLAAHRAKNLALANIRTPKTWYLASDGLLDFMSYNALEEMPTIKYRDLNEIKHEYPYLSQIFKNSLLSPEVMEGLRLVLEDMGDKPLIVRSSSLLEDSAESAFAGKYKSLFVSNQGSKAARLDALKDAVAEVYASTFGPDPIEYRRERGLLDFNEEMAIMIQEVVGKQVGKHFFPAFAGVAFSYNEFRWSPRIRREDGIIRLVTGLGTRAVDRMGDDYPMLVCPGQPGLRANITADEVIRYSQRQIDAINLETGRFETVCLEKLFQEHSAEFPQLAQIVSLDREGQLSPPLGNFVNLRDGVPVVTFANLLESSPFIGQIKACLQILKDTFGWPVDIEFAAGEEPGVLYLLQCRPQSHFGTGGQIAIPHDIAEGDRLFSAEKYVTSSLVAGIEYLVYVDPMAYDQLPTYEAMTLIGRVVSELNSRLPSRKFILMGPGRWGSRGDIKLGVQVGYSDINNTAMLIEIARRKKGYTPDLSFGTHFFQDLVEAEIRYLPLYPDEPGNIFNEAFFLESDNALASVVPWAAETAGVVRLIHIPAVSGGATVSVAMDGENERALAFLKR